MANLYWKKVTVGSEENKLYNSGTDSKTLQPRKIIQKDLLFA